MTTPSPRRSDSETTEPLTVRCAASVVLIRDAGGVLEAFLMRRHRGMEFAAGVTVFPGGGVDERDLDDEVPWHGPDRHWWAARFGVEPKLAAGLVCAAVRETFEETGVLFAGHRDSGGRTVDPSVYQEGRAQLADGRMSFGDFLRREGLVLRADLLRPWDHWVTPEEERTRRYDTYFFVGAVPVGQQADGVNSESESARWARPRSALDEFAEGANFLLPPTWAQLDTLDGRSVAEALTAEPTITAVQPSLQRRGDQWQVIFDGSPRYEALRKSRMPG